MNSISTTPLLEVSKHKWTTVTSSVMYASTNGQPVPQRTSIDIMVDEEALHVQFTCLDNPYHALNTYVDHNTDMWNQEVFEVFIAPDQEVPKRYMELEINPNNALFSAWVDNPDGRSLQLTFVDYQVTGIEHEVTTSNDSWKGKMRIPFSLIGKSDTYRLNFYRIALNKEPREGEWTGSPDNSDYMCWHSTLSGDQPAFHRPARFGTLKIQP